MHTAYTYARGEFQIDCINRMLGDGCSDSLMFLTGKAKSWSGQYRKSLQGLVKRLRAANITVELRPSGPRGGARWHIVD